MARMLAAALMFVAAVPPASAQQAAQGTGKRVENRRRESNMRIKIRQGLLFVAGCAFSGLALSPHPEGVAGLVSNGVVLWLAFYPFATSTSLPERVYWMFLFVGLPVAVYLRSSALAPIYEKAALAMFVIAVAGYTGQVLLRRRSRMS